jgi:MFS transporter, MCT family, solute carrier family 16 (monocarboxylic acid transporters), member 10
MCDINIRIRFTCGAYVALLPNPMIEFGETADVGRRIGMFTTIFAAGALVGPPISGAIYVATGGFETVGYYAGLMIFLPDSPLPC